MPDREEVPEEEKRPARENGHASGMMLACAIYPAVPSVNSLLVKRFLGGTLEPVPAEADPDPSGD